LSAAKPGLLLEHLRLLDGDAIMFRWFWPIINFWKPATGPRVTLPSTRF